MTKNPIPVLLHCPSCREPHVCGHTTCHSVREAPELHACVNCGRQWQPCEYPTIGVVREEWL